MSFFFGPSKTGAAEGRLFTWEVVTAFDSSPSKDFLRQEFQKEFPDFPQWNPRFCPMVSFNSSDGRKHRILVFLLEQDLELSRKKFDRVMPRQLAYFSLADEAMKVLDCDGNFLYGAWQADVLEVLIFQEGRLCFFSEEAGYDSLKLVEKRMEGLKEFLKKDDLFSKVENYGFYLETFESGIVADGNLAVLLNRHFSLAAQDPFWKKWDLDETPGLKPRTKHRLIGWAFVLLTLMGVWVDGSLKELLGWDSENRNVLWGAESSFLNLESIELDDYPVVEMMDEERVLHKDLEKLRREKSSEKLKLSSVSVQSPVCLRPAAFVEGLVEGKVAQVRMDGKSRWMKVGDSLGDYEVASINRDCLVLRCRTENWELKNGR